MKQRYRHCVYNPSLHNVHLLLQASAPVPMFRSKPLWVWNVNNKNSPGDNILLFYPLMKWNPQIHILSSNVLGMKCAICSNIVPSCIDGHNFLSVFFHYPSDKQLQLSFSCAFTAISYPKPTGKGSDPCSNVYFKRSTIRTPYSCMERLQVIPKISISYATQTHKVVIWFFL